MDLNNQVHGERLIQNTTINPKSRGWLLPSHGGERCEDVGQGGESVGGNSGSSSPSNLPPAAACSLSVFVFLIYAFVYHKINSEGGGGIYRRFKVKRSMWPSRLRRKEPRSSRWPPPCSLECCPHGGPILSLRGLLVHFFFSSCLNSRKNDPWKRLGPFNVRKVSETQNT
jgi:hypothetical protein